MDKTNVQQLNQQQKKKKRKNPNEPKEWCLIASAIAHCPRERSLDILNSCCCSATTSPTCRRRRGFSKLDLRESSAPEQWPPESLK